MGALGGYDWPEPALDMLKKLWAEGLSASQISGKINLKLGARLTRSAIIGKVHRLKLDKRREAYEPAVRTTVVHRSNVNVERMAALPRPIATPSVPPQVDVPPRRPDANGCRWPLGDPIHANFRFCCKTIDTTRTFAGRAVYCEDHARRAIKRKSAAA